MEARGDVSRETIGCAMTAIEWLQMMAGHSAHGHYAREIQDMLERPTLPKEPTCDVANLMWRAAVECGQTGTLYMLAAYRALYAHLTAPKFVDVKATALLDERGAIIGFSWTDADGVYHSVDIGAKRWREPMPIATITGTAELKP